MSAEDCIAEIRAAAGDEISDDEIADLITTLRSKQRERQRVNQGESAEETILRAADEMRDDLITEKLIEKRNTYLNWRRRTEAMDFVRSNFSDDFATGLEAILVGVNRVREGSRLSAASEQRSLVNKYTTGFLADVEQQGLWDVFVSGAIDREISREMWEIGRPEGQRGISGSDEAAKLAEISHKWQEVARNDANLAGAWIKRSPGYIVRQSHDKFKIRKATYEEWRDFILPKLDGRTFDGVEDQDEFLKFVYQGLAAGIHYANNEAAPSGFKGFANLAKRMSEDRVLHFKNADDWFDYNTRFGTGSLREAFLFGFDRTGRQTALMKILGPNPEANFTEIRNQIRSTIKQSGTEQDIIAFERKQTMLDNRFAEVDGSVNIAGNEMAARISATWRAVQSSAKLGGATISAISDAPIAASELKYQGMGYLEALGIAMQSPLKGMPSAEQKQVLGMMGVMLDGINGTAAYRYSGHDDLPGKASKYLQTFFKWNGLTWWTDTMRSNIALAMSHRLALLKNQPWKKLDPDLKRTLSLYGIADEGDWSLIQKAANRMADGREYATPEGIMDLPDEAIREVIGANASANKVREYRNGLEGRLRNYFSDRTDFAVIQPDARTNSMLKQGTRPGTVMGEFARFVTQFKGFPAAVIVRTLGRELYGRGADTIGAQLAKGIGANLGLAQFLVTTAAFGYMAMTVKDLLRGKKPRPPNEPTTWTAAMLQGGGLGIYGDFLFGDMRNRYGHTILSSLGGPTAGTVEDVADLWGRMWAGDDLAAPAFNAALNHTPYANLFYTRTAIDYLFLHQVREMLNPGYLKRAEKRAKKQLGQEYFLKPSQAVPTGGGNRVFEGVR